MSRPLTYQKRLPSDEAEEIALVARRALLRELTGNKCRCGKEKAHRTPFCGACLLSLPTSLSAQLHKRIGFGYEEVYELACRYLELKTKAASR